MVLLWGHEQYERKKKCNKTKKTIKLREKKAKIFFRWRLEKDLLRNWFANWNNSNKAREAFLKSTPSFFWARPCLTPADRTGTPYGSPAVCPHCPHQEETQSCSGTKDIKARTWKYSTGKIQPAPVELQNIRALWYFMSMQLQLQTSQAHTELSGPSASIHWVGKGCIFPERIHFSKLWAVLIQASIWLTVRLWATMDVSPSQHNRNSQTAKKHWVKTILSLFTCQAISFLKN